MGEGFRHRQPLTHSRSWQDRAALSRKPARGEGAVTNTVLAAPIFSQPPARATTEECAYFFSAAGGFFSAAAGAAAAGAPAAAPGAPAAGAAPGAAPRAPASGGTPASAAAAGAAGGAGSGAGLLLPPPPHRRHV